MMLGWLMDLDRAASCNGAATSGLWSAGIVVGLLLLLLLLLPAVTPARFRSHAPAPQHCSEAASLPRPCHSTQAHSAPLRRKRAPGKAGDRRGRG
jgi:hypothetical protein